MVYTALCEFCQRNYELLSLSDHDKEAEARGGDGLPIAQVIGQLIGSGNAVAEDIRSYLAMRYDELGDGAFDPAAFYTKKLVVDADDFEEDWILFKESLNGTNRFFNKVAESILCSIFADLDRYETRSGKPIISQVGPEEEISVVYRARVFQSNAGLKEAMIRPDKHLAPPPASLAVAGRMNAEGISVFYGATDPNGALAEVRPPVGSRVLIASFEIVRPLKLLDLQALESIVDEKGSVFDQAYVHWLKRAQFVRGLSRLVSRPIMPNDSSRDYLPTQALADYLATAATLPLDGMLYTSVQVDHPHKGASRLRFGRSRESNVVLFHHAAHVEGLSIADDVKVSVRTDSWLESPFGEWDSVAGFADEDPDLKYFVIEEVPKGIHRPVTENFFPPSDNDPPLRFLSLEARYIKCVNFETSGNPVPRHRSEQGT
jgi:RES domain